MENALITYRKAEGLTQAELAERIGVKAPAICKWEKKQVPAERIVDVEKATGIPRALLRPDLFEATVQIAEAS